MHFCSQGRERKVTIHFSRITITNINVFCCWFNGLHRAPHWTWLRAARPSRSKQSVLILSVWEVDVWAQRSRYCPCQKVKASLFYSNSLKVSYLPILKKKYDKYHLNRFNLNMIVVHCLLIDDQYIKMYLPHPCPFHFDVTFSCIRHTDIMTGHKGKKKTIFNIQIHRL